MLQHSSDDFIYKAFRRAVGKPLAAEYPMDDVRESVVPLFVAQGTRDGTSASADLFTLEAIRQQPNRPIRYVVVEQGDHGFETSDGKSHLSALFDDFVGWARDTNRHSGLGVLK
jgi:hypothetical protein